MNPLQKNILRKDAFGDSKPSRKKIAIVFSTEEVTAKRQAFVQSFWSGMPIEDIPFVIVVGIGKYNALKSMLRLAENPCYVISVPDFENLNAALPILKQRLCEVMSNDDLNPSAQLQNRIRRRAKDDDVKYEFSEKTLGLPICNSEFNLFVSYHIGDEENVKEKLSDQETFIENLMEGFANYGVHHVYTQRNPRQNGQWTPSSPDSGYKRADNNIPLKPRARKPSRSIADVMVISNELATCPNSNNLPKYLADTVTIVFYTGLGPRILARGGIANPEGLMKRFAYLKKASNFIIGIGIGLSGSEEVEFKEIVEKYEGISKFISSSEASAVLKSLSNDEDGLRYILRKLRFANNRCKTAWVTFSLPYKCINSTVNISTVSIVQKLRTLEKELCEHIGDKTFKTVKVEEPIQVLITGTDSEKGANKDIAQTIRKIQELKQAENPEKDVVVTLFSKDKGPKKIYNVGKHHRIL